MCHQFDMVTWSKALEFAEELDVSCGRMPADKGMDLFETADAPSESGMDSVLLARPGSSVPVVTAKGVTLLNWGFTTSWSKGLVFNTRIESALGGSVFWGDALESRRCVIPATAFYETHATEKASSLRTGRAVKRRYRFTLAASNQETTSPHPAEPQPFFLAGVYGEGCFSVVTTAPNDSVVEVHDRMPIVLNAAEAKRWLSGALDDLRVLADCSHVVLDSAPVEQERTAGSRAKTARPSNSDEPLQFSLF